MSLRIKINKEDIKLSADFEMAITLQSEFFDNSREDVTYPVSVDLNSNREALGFPDRINAQVSEEYPASVSFGPYQVLNGRSVFTEIDSNSVELYIATDKHSFWGQVRNEYLDELGLGSIGFATSDYMLDDFTKSLTTKKPYVVCPLQDNYVSNILVQERNFYNFLDPFTLVFKRNNNGKLCYFTPFFRLKWLIESVFREKGYIIEKNDIDLDNDFDDVIVICRRNPIHPDTKRFVYSDHVPHITLYDFLREIENKFGYCFVVREESRTVSILRMEYIENQSMEVIDGVKKSFISSEDRKTSFVYKDIGSQDEKVKAYEEKGLTQVFFGAGEDSEVIECISTIVGIDLAAEQIVEPNNGGKYPKYYCFAAVQANYNDIDAYNNTVKTEFRLSVYRGLANAYDVSIAGYRAGFDYPIASPEPIKTMPNKLSLLWSGDASLGWYKMYKSLLLLDATQKHEFSLLTDISLLNNLSELFSRELIIHNRRYRCFEQEITISVDRIIAHVIRCYPL